MAKVRFAETCDYCLKRSPEYTNWFQCVECMVDVCDDCVSKGSENHESLKGLCKECAYMQAKDLFEQVKDVYEDWLISCNVSAGNCR